MNFLNIAGYDAKMYMDNEKATETMMKRERVDTFSTSIEDNYHTADFSFYKNPLLF